MEAKREGNILVQKSICEFDVFKSELYRFVSYRETSTCEQKFLSGIDVHAVRQGT